MLALLAILVVIVFIFHLISTTFPNFVNLAAIFTAFAYIYALFIVLASFKKHEDRFVFLNLFLATLIMPGAVELASEMGYGYPASVMVWLTTFFVIGLISLIFSLKRMEKYELSIFFAFLIVLNGMNAYYWAKLNKVEFEPYNLVIAYGDTMIKSLTFFYKSFLNVCYHPTYLFYLKGEEQIFIAPFFVLLFAITFMLRRI
ncbi:hypothetical protein DRP05_08060 [Archaeoglobales archaeon]|nr:MAG: hypothetical protein DRP05_08060 [Archaeoglobales archaeon]